GDVQDPAVRTNRDQFRGGGGGGRGRDIHEFEGNDLDLPSELANAVEIFVGVDELLVADLAGRRVVIRRIDQNAVTQFARRQGEHAPELSAAQHADGGAGQKRGRIGFWIGRLA